MAGFLSAVALGYGPTRKAAYHVISRTALHGLPFGKEKKDELVRIIQRLSAIYAVDVLGYAIMSNHFHLLVAVSPGSMVFVDEIRRRLQLLYGGETESQEGLLGDYRARFCGLSAYVSRLSCTSSG